ncbi:MAG: hypothetical protein D6725_03085 [Planctomycetota bacterium]|nr:MAG: hypothetical protein D6725_03085 [Planctomycetota bacterium]
MGTTFGLAEAICGRRIEKFTLNDPYASTIFNPGESERAAAAQAAGRSGVSDCAAGRADAPPVERILATIRDNGLVRSSVFAAVEKAVRSGELASAEALIRHLVRRGQITEWQGERLLAGRTGFWVGPYLLQRLLGSGGMGVVLKARREGWSDPVAIKVLSRAMLRKESARRRFEREVEAALALRHPNIIRALEAGCLNDIPYLVMEYVRGKDLRHIVRSRGPLPIDLACDLTIQVARGLAYAHRKGLVHRDVKPANLLVTRPTRHEPLQVKILDFGLALTCGDDWGDADLTHSNQIFGTVDFISPEQARSAHAVDARSDIFSLGCTLYYLLTGTLPFGGSSVMEKITARFTDAPTPVSRYRADIPQQLEAVLMRMLARRPEDRWPDCESVAAALCPFGREAARRGGSLLPQTLLTAPGPPERGDGGGSEQALERFLSALQHQRSVATAGERDTPGHNAVLVGPHTRRSWKPHRRRVRRRWSLRLRGVVRTIRDRVRRRPWVSCGIGATAALLMVLATAGHHEPPASEVHASPTHLGRSVPQRKGGPDGRAAGGGTLRGGGAVRAGFERRPLVSWPPEWGAIASGTAPFDPTAGDPLCDAMRPMLLRRYGRVRIDAERPAVFAGGWVTVEDSSGAGTVALGSDASFSVELVLAVDGVTAEPCTIVAATADGRPRVLWELRQNGPTLEWFVEGRDGPEVVSLATVARRSPCHVVLVDEPERLQAWLNGSTAVDVRREARRLLPATDWELFIGGRPGAAVWRGAIARVALYPRALSRHEVRRLLMIALRHARRMARGARD